MGDIHFPCLIENSNSLAPPQDAVSGFTFFPNIQITSPPQTSPSLKNGVCIPQKRYRKGADGDDPANQNLVLFVWEDGSFIPVAMALEKDYTGLVNSDLLGLGETGFMITV